MKQFIQYGDVKIYFDVIDNPTLTEKVRIHVHPNSMVEVETPVGTKMLEIYDAVRKRARWVSKQLIAASETQKHALPRYYVSGETHFYVGRRYQLRVIECNRNQSRVSLKGSRIEVRLPHKDPAAVRRRLNEWYQSRGKSYFQKRIKGIVDRISWLDEVPEMKLVSMQKQWGSCAPDRKIHLNPWLIRAPSDCIDYVITHEICHLQERNHGKKFYELLGRHHPDWQHTKARLDGMAEVLLAV